MEQKRCISSLTLAELSAELKALGQPGFRAKQIFHWVHQKLVTEFSAMTDQPKTLLAKLEEQKADLEAQMAAHDPSDYEGLGKLNEQLQAVTDESESLEMEWMELSEQLE